MKEITVEDLLNLKHGDSVFKITGDSWIRLHYVGRMPKNERYLVFCHGESLFHEYITKDNTFKGEYYGGEYDDTFLLKKSLQFHKKMVQSIERDLSNSIKKELSKRK